MVITIGSQVKEFHILNKLGEGSYANVYRVRRTTDKKVYAMKVIKEFSMKREDKISLINEINILAKHKCDYLIKFHEVFTYRSSFFIVMEHAVNKDLASLIKSNRSKQHFFNKNDISKWIYQLSIGLKYLHDRNVIHRDLKPANILLDSHYNIKICDFGISKIHSSGNYLAKTQIGSPIYMSPETVSNKWYDNKVDLWALGCIFFELITLDYAFNAKTMPALFKVINRGKYSKHKINNVNYIALLDKLLQVDPKDRFNIQQVIDYLPRVFRDDSLIHHNKNNLKVTRIRILPALNIPSHISQWESILPSPSYEILNRLSPIHFNYDKENSCTEQKKLPPLKNFELDKIKLNKNDKPKNIDLEQIKNNKKRLPKINDPIINKINNNAIPINKNEYVPYVRELERRRIAEKLYKIKNKSPIYKYY